MIDLPNEHDIVALFPYRAEQKLLLASNDGRGFILAGEEALAQTRGGKQVLTPGDGARAIICQPVMGDAAAFLGDNRKLLICKVDEIPEMSRGRGVILQRYKDASLVDAKTFTLGEGLSWRQGENRTRTETDLAAWIGPRASSGRVVPSGFPKSNRFG